MDEYDYLYDNPQQMDSWRWFLQKSEWVKEIKKQEEVRELAAKRKSMMAQQVVTHSGGNYDTIQLEVMMSLEDGSTLYGACGNPDCDLDKPIHFPPSLDLPAQKTQEGDDSWMPFEIEVAPIVGYIM